MRDLDRNKNNQGDHFFIDRLTHDRRKFLQLTNHLTISSMHRNGGSYNGSTDFTFYFPINFQYLKNIRKVELLSGSIPNHVAVSVNNGTTVTPYLFLVIKDLDGSNVNSNRLDNKALAVLRWDFIVGTLTTEFINVKFDNLYYSFENENRIRQLRVQIYDNNGNLFSFGNDNISAVSFTNANPTVVTVPVNHGVNVGDLIYIENFNNASSKSVKNYIEQQGGWYVSAVTATTLTFNSTLGVLDLSFESANQNDTNVENVYQLGRDIIIYKYPGTSQITWTPGTSSFSLANPTVIDVSPVTHGLTTGDQVQIKEFNNGTTQFINQLVNQVNVVTVLTPSTFSIPVDLSAQLATQQLTDTQAPYTLGLNANLRPAKHQVSFDLKFITTQHEMFNS